MLTMHIKSLPLWNKYIVVSNMKMIVSYKMRGTFNVVFLTACASDFEIFWAGLVNSFYFHK